MASTPLFASKLKTDITTDVVAELSANSDVPYRATLAEAVAEFPVGYYFKTDDKAGVGPHPGELWIYQRTAGAPGYVAQIAASASTADIDAALIEANALLTQTQAAATSALNYGNAVIRGLYTPANAEAFATGTYVQILSSDTGTHTPKAGDYNPGGGNTPNRGIFIKDDTLSLVRVAETMDELARQQAAISATQAGIATTKASEASASATAAASGATAGSIPVVQKAETADTNWFNKLTITPNVVLNKNTGATAAAAGYFTSDYFFVPPEGFMFSGVIGFPNNALYGAAFYDATNTYVGGYNSASAPYTVPSWTNIARPVGAVKARICGSNTFLEAGHVVYGSTQPAAFKSFGAQDAYSASLDANARLNAALPGINLWNPDKADSKGIPIAFGNLVQGYINQATGLIVAGGNFSSPADPIPVTPGQSYTMAFLVQGSAQTGVSWYAADGVTRVTPPSVSLSGYTVTAPVNAYFMKPSWPDVWPKHASANQQVIVAGTTLPASYRGPGKVSSEGAAIVAQKRVEMVGNPVMDFFDHLQRIEDTILDANGNNSVSYGNDLSNLIPGYPGCQRYINGDANKGSGSARLGFYDRNGDLLFLGFVTGGAVTVTNGSPTVTLTSLTAGRLYKGMPASISTTYFPANTYVVDFSDPKGGLGTVTLSANALADGAAIAFSGGGVQRDVPITYPDPACGMRFPFSNTQGYYLQATSGPITTQGAFGLRQMRARMPLLGQPVNIVGDSNAAAGSDGGGGAPPQFGTVQWLLRKECGFQLIEARGSGGATTRELLDDRSQGYGAAVGVVFTATLTAGATTLGSLSVQSGTLVAGQRVSALNGGVPFGTTLVDLGGGSWGLSAPATVAGTAVGMRAGNFAGVRYVLDESGGNSWGIAAAGITVAQRANANVVLGNVTDVWVPTDFTATVTAGQTTITGTLTVTRGALANGMPVLAVSDTNLAVGTTLVDLGGGSWGLSAPALKSGSAIAFRAGTYCGDLYDIFIRKIMTWEPGIYPIMTTPGRRWDCTANPNATGVDAADIKPGDPMNTQGVRLSQFAQMKIDWAKYYGIPCTDLFNTLPVNASNYTLYMNTDLLHFNRLGYTRLWAPAIARFVNAQPFPQEY